MEKKPIGYRFTGIEIISRSMAPQPIEEWSGLFNFDVNIETRVKPDIKAVIPFVRVTVKNDEADVAQMVVACVFEIDDFDHHIRMNDQQVYQIPDELQQYITPVSISTTRGVLFSEFRGTWLHHAVLPLIPVQQLEQRAAAKKVTTSPGA